MGQTDLVTLYDNLIDRYRTIEDLRELCFRLGVNYDDLLGEGRRAKARELVQLLAHDDRQDELSAMLDAGRSPAQVAQPEAQPLPKIEDAAEPLPWPDYFVHPKSGIAFIRVVAGPFIFGSPADDPMAAEDETPWRFEDLPDFWLARTPLTNDQFERFVSRTDYLTTAEIEGYGLVYNGEQWQRVYGADWRHPRGPKSHISGRGDHPVVQISWDDAQAYADWAGLRLPTEQEWEKAARFMDMRRYPWGDSPPNSQRCNFDNDMGETTPVGRYSPAGDGPYGHVDLAGNVWEWTLSWYDESWGSRVMRGGSWAGDAAACRCATRNGSLPHGRSDDRGARMVIVPA